MKQLALTLGLFAVVTLGQRVVPGVNPNQYQQQQQQQQYHPPPQQQYQQVPQQQMHYQQQQQVHYQQQQVPVQQQQQYQQVPVQQQHHQQQQPQHTPQQHGDHGVHHGQQQQVLNPNNIQHEKQHIAEHMEVPIDTSKMSEQELQFHYFKMHDSDNNNKLDGCELIKSLIHWHAESKNQEATGQPGHQDKIFSNDELSALIDPILNSDDHNKDGFIDYPEFVRAQHKAAQQGEAPQQ
ncbi:multiple coagulation factor deficiency protein 2 homolog isoform X2 [Toxorhynchites rutilus septentrionalis]|uniref:multiple coagulation factor deficiency protein 2 homolog isoform X2 n=1 Tax=Toxorhynchites rutilus septentrionalis TaxID=329112 RepID=UPI0024796951|nr:multiple coagulation factor deficiency protein 2 homolog isoform X2 [Toxorhynchites rutilus septentrionalis]